MLSFDIPGMGKSAGAIFLATSLNFFLFGVLTCQVYIYSIAFSRDRLPIFKAVVFSVYVLEAVQTIMIIYDAFQTFVVGFLSPESLLRVGTLWISIPLLSGIITVICQGLFAYRIWIIADRKLVKVAFWLIVITSIIQLAAATGLGILLKDVARFDLANRDIFRMISSIWFAGSAVGDGLIATCMLHVLFRIKSSTAVDPPRQILHRAIHLAIGTGSVTAAIAIITLALVLLPGDTNYYQASSAILGKLYSNSMLVLLNNRLTIESRAFVSRGDHGQILEDSSYKHKLTSFMARSGATESSQSEHTFSAVGH